MHTTAMVQLCTAQLHNCIQVWMLYLMFRQSRVHGNQCRNRKHIAATYIFLGFGMASRHTLQWSFFAAESSPDMTTRALLSAFALLRSWSMSPLVVAVPCKQAQQISSRHASPFGGQHWLGGTSTLNHQPHTRINTCSVKLAASASGP